MTLTGNDELEEPQELVSVTPTLPETAEVVQVVIMDAVPDPEVIVTPEGTVHV